MKKDASGRQDKKNIYKNVVEEQRQCGDDLAGRQQTSITTPRA